MARALGIEESGTPGGMFGLEKSLSEEHTRSGGAWMPEFRLHAHGTLKEGVSRSFLLIAERGI